METKMEKDSTNQGKMLYMENLRNIIHLRLLSFLSV